MIYYNEFDPFAAQWLRNLMANGHLPNGVVDERSIKEVERVEATTGHFFAGIGGWPLALELAGWPADRPVWTGSCPCQPFSAAGKRQGESDERHLWPEFFRLIRQHRPATIFGEQVASNDGLRWLDGVFADLEGAGYTCGAADLCAAGLGSPHIRQRLYWVAFTQLRGLEGQDIPVRQSRQEQAAIEQRRIDLGLANTNVDVVQRIASAWQQSEHEQDVGNGRLEHSASDRRQQWRSESGRGSVASGCGNGGLRNAGCTGLEGWRLLASGCESKLAAWAASRVIRCLDGKSRRVGCSVQPLAHGIPVKLGHLKPRLEGMGINPRLARSNRVGRLKGYGNAIVPELAAVFVRAFLESEPQRKAA